MLPLQALDGLHTIFLGVTIGLIMDMYRVLIALLQPRKPVTAVYDLLFWLGTTLWAFTYLLLATTGEGHVYVVLLLGVGYFLEQRLLGRQLRAAMKGSILAIVRVVSRVFFALAEVVDAILTALVAPYRFFYRLIKKPIAKLVYLASKPIVALRNRIRGLFTKLMTRWRGNGEEN